MFDKKEDELPISNKQVLYEKRILVTGGAGVIGSRISQLLSETNELTILDNLSSGSYENISTLLRRSNVKFIKGDVKDHETVGRAMADVDIVIHLAANADVRYSEELGTDLDFKINTIGTYNILEQMRLKDVGNILFSSSSSVYGYAEKLPTEESYSTTFPRSLYAASKAASESIISAFSYMFGLRSVIFRFANITAPIYRSRGRNVIPDFILKLTSNPNELEILGDGEQEKSYLYVDDCINGMLTCFANSSSPVDVFNLGNADTTKVNKIAQIIIEEMGLKNVRLKYSGGEIGWKGDVPKTILSIKKALGTGWSIKYNSDEAVRESAKRIINILRAR